MNDTLKKFLVSQLRRISYKWPAFTEARRRARVAYGEYTCAKCGEVCRAKEVQLDHIVPVIPLTGWDGLEPFAERLFCEPEALQILCLECHHYKTKRENARRTK